MDKVRPIIKNVLGKLATVRKTPAWVALICGVVAGLLLAGPFTYAAANSLPGQPLYPAKSASEWLHVTFTPTLVGRANIRIDQNERRYWELQQLDKRPASNAALITASEKMVAADNATMEAMEAAKKHNKDIRPLVKRFCDGLEAQQDFLKELESRHPGLKTIDFQVAVRTVDEYIDHAMDW